MAKNAPQLGPIIFGLFFMLSTQALALSEDDVVVLTNQAVQTNSPHLLLDIMHEPLTCHDVEGCRSAIDVALQEVDDLIFKSRGERAAEFQAFLKGLLQSQLATSAHLSVLHVGVSHYGRQFTDRSTLTSIFDRLQSEQIDRATALRLYSLKTYLPRQFNSLLREIEFRYQKDIQTLSDRSDVTRYELARDLLYDNPPIEDYASGAYAGKPRLYMFCRKNRIYPCLMLMRYKNGEVYKTPNGKIWTQPSLGYSRHKKDFNERNGNTPSGVFRIDGVMPEADQKLVYGKHRRLILNFVGSTSDEVNQKKLLPRSSHSTLWWREAVVARDIGRGLFRIHGTGLRSSSSQPYFPFKPTSGCVAQRENKYDQINYNDQRILLNDLMHAADLPPIFANEPHIKGLLYIINIDNTAAPVTLKDLENKGVL